MIRKKVLSGELVMYGALFYLLAAGTVEVAFAYEDERDGQVYFETKIGEQVWMTKNMNWSDGGAVGLCPTADPDGHCDYFGRMYTWDEALNVCPVGWHLPTVDEWRELAESVGGADIAGRILKSADVNASFAWALTGGGAGLPSTDDYGFTAFPGGWIKPKSTVLHALGTDGVWWSATPQGSIFPNRAYRFKVSADYDHLDEDHRNKGRRFNVRCVKGYKDERDGQVYPEARIGEQIWMTRNMNWSDGDTVGHCSEPPGYTTITRSQNSYCDTFGRLYTWSEASASDGTEGVCPAPWRLPSDEDWEKLRSYLETELHGVDYVDRAGMRLKATDYADIGGAANGRNGTNEFGFDAIPTGHVDSDDTILYSRTKQSVWWSSAENSSANASGWALWHDTDGGPWRKGRNKGDLYSVRCVRESNHRTYEVNLPDLRNVGVYLSRKQTSDTDALAYAENVNGPNPLERRLSDWKESNGFVDSSIRQSVRAVYYNGTDLGFGRDMVCNQQTADGVLLRAACYVSNYGFAGSYDQVNERRSPSSTPEEAFADFHAGIPFATVAMEYSRNAPNPVRFFVFGPNEDPLCASTPGCDPADGRLQTKAALDSGGPKNVPGICLSCHGGTLQVGENGSLAVVGSHFLPFDPFSFEYDTGIPATGEIPSPEHQQRAAFKELNAIVYKTEAQGSPIRQLIGGLYGGDPSNEGSHDQEDVSIPEGFDDSPVQRDAYRYIVKPYCRGCHVAQTGEPFSVEDPPSQVATSYPYFLEFAEYPCDPIVDMPHAEHTDRRFLANVFRTEPGQYSSAVETLRAILGDPNYECQR